jgi:hypothetical protein
VTGRECEKSLPAGRLVGGAYVPHRLHLKSPPLKMGFICYEDGLEEIIAQILDKKKYKVYSTLLSFVKYVT